MQPLTSFRHKGYPPRGPFVQLGDSQIGRDLQEADELMRQNLDHKIHAGKQRRSDMHNESMEKLKGEKLLPTHYSIADDNSEYDDVASSTHIHEVPRPEHLPVFPDNGSQFYGDIPVPSGDDHELFQEAHGGEMVKAEASHEQPSRMSMVGHAAVDAVKYMGTNLKNNVIGTVNLARSTAIVGGQIAGVLGPELQKSAETYKDVLEIAGPPIVYGGYIAAKTGFDITKFFAKTAWSLADVLNAIDDSSSEPLAIEDPDVGTVRLNGTFYRRARNDTPPRRSQASSSSSDKTYESYDSVDAWKRNSHSSKTYLMEQIYKRDGWGKVLSVADHTTGYHYQGVDFRKKLLHMSADDMAQILLKLDGKS